MQITDSCLSPTPRERIAQAVANLRIGLPCVLNHENDRVVVVSVETLVEGRFDALLNRFGQPELVITPRRAQAVMSSAAAASIPTSPIRILPPENATLLWYKELADPQYDTFGVPSGPLHLIRDIDTQAQQLAVKLVKTAELLPAVLIFAISPQDTALDLSAGSLDVRVGLDALSEQPSLLTIAAAGLPLEVHDTSKLHVFQDEDGQTEHYAIEIGHPDRATSVLSRLHSACFTGDVLGSRKCDCGPQLQAALTQMGDEGAGVLLYLNQEGRGIGLANKMRVYDLQSKGLDTVEANHRLGFEDDERDFRIAARILLSLGFGSIRLLTNNPAKVDTFKANGITITEQIPLRVAQNVHNQNYLAVKALKSGHML